MPAFDLKSVRPLLLLLHLLSLFPPEKRPTEPESEKDLHCLAQSAWEHRGKRRRLRPLIFRHQTQGDVVPDVAVREEVERLKERQDGLIEVTSFHHRKHFPSRTELPADSKCRRPVNSNQFD